jgi:hypothetical protein
LLFSWCAGGRYGMACNEEDHGRSRRPSAEDRGWSHRSGTQWSGDREVGWCCMRSAPCTWRRGAHVSWLSPKTKVDGLSVVWPQNHWDSFFVVWPQNLLSRFLAVWPQNLLRRFLPVWPQNRWWVSWLNLKTKVVEGFPDWASKPAALIC